MEKNQKTVLGLVAVALLISVIYLLPSVLSQTTSRVCTVNGDCIHEEQLAFLQSITPAFVIAGFILGVLAFFFFGETRKVERIESKPEKETVLKLLEKDERKILARVVEEGGRVLQSELSHIEGVGKVKAHRIVDRLVSRGVIEKESHGKTNLVKLTKEMQKLF